MGEWKEVYIEEIGSIENSRRIPLSKLQRAERQGPFPYYGASGVIDSVDGYLFEGEHVLISEDGENLRSRNTPIAFKANGKFWVNNHAHIIKARSPVWASYLVYYFQQLELTPYITGAVQPKLSKKNLCSIPIWVPSDKSQFRFIVEILSSLDDKIDLLRRQNATLEGLAGALFREWFESSKERSGWIRQSLYDSLKLVGGGTPKTGVENYWGGKYGWLSGGDISDNHRSFVISPIKSVTKKGLQNSSAKLLPKYSTVISARGTVGKYCLLGKEMSFSQSNYGVLPKSGKCFFYTYLLLGSEVQKLQNSAYGSVFDTITTRTFKNTIISFPPFKLRSSFEATVEPFFLKILFNQLQVQQLTSLRSLLLSKLLSDSNSLLR